ncbi:MAG: alpha/beta hydrolase [Paracoccaceae bacterium]
MDPDIAYENASFIPDAAAYPERWQTEARAWREAQHDIGRARLNLAYGTTERQRLDLFLPAGRPGGLLIFIHGGYWRMFERQCWSHFAAGATARGWVVAMPSYTLAPQARIRDITAEIANAVTHTAGLAPGSIVITGHSAGGHLAARMVCRDVALPDAVAARIKRVVPISPLSDLRPLMQTKMNDDLRLDAAEAGTESPALQRALRDIPVTVWVGAEERPAFLDQARWLADAWPNAKLHVDPGRHHFDVIDGLCDPGSPLMCALLGGL